MPRHGDVAAEATAVPGHPGHVAQAHSPVALLSPRPVSAPVLIVSSGHDNELLCGGATLSTGVTSGARPLAWSRPAGQRRHHGSWLGWRSGGGGGCPATYAVLGWWRGPWLPSAIRAGHEGAAYSTESASLGVTTLLPQDRPPSGLRRPPARQRHGGHRGAGLTLHTKGAGAATATAHVTRAIKWGDAIFRIVQLRRLRGHTLWSHP
jgi:hypothetical protein